MNTLQQAAAIIRRAEEDLRPLLAQAAESGLYDDVLALTASARQLQRILGDLEGHAVPEMPAPADAAVTAPVGAVNAGVRPAPANRLRAGSHAVTGKTRRPGRKAVRAAPAPRKSRGVPEGYPRFFREGNVLVKLGWSRTEKAPYEHKAPRKLVDLLADAVGNAGRGGRRFTTEEVLHLEDPKEGSELPGYQVYLALAWLRIEGLVVQHGRQGYSLPPGIDLPRAVEEHWQRLPER